MKDNSLYALQWNTLKNSLSTFNALGLNTLFCIANHDTNEGFCNSNEKMIRNMLIFNSW